MTRFAIALLTLTVVSPAAADTMNGHTVVLDEAAKIKSWLPQEDAFADVQRRAWRALREVIPVDPRTGLKLYYLYPFLNDPEMLGGVDWVHHPAGMFSYLAASAERWYAYSGDRDVVALVEEVLDYHLAHGMTPLTYDWGGVPYSCSQAGATEYTGGDVMGPGGPGDGTGVLEPDKIGELGYAWIRFFQLTGNTSYRDAAIASASALARHAIAGDATHSPWPYRVNAETGAVVEEYTAHVIGPLRLFDELIRLGLGDVAAYRAARTLAWNWLMAFPMRTNLWSKYFEDVAAQPPESNVNQYIAGETARYLLENPELDPDWEAHARGLLAWIEEKFATEQWGANAIREQTVYFFLMGSHTARYGAVQAVLAEKTGDAIAKDRAFRALNWATYMALENGVVITGPETGQGGIWFSDGYGDYMRHFMIAIGAVPEWAPARENHLLRSTSVVKDVRYDTAGVHYETHDASATEVLRVAFVPGSVLADGNTVTKRTELSGPSAGWTFDAATGVVRVRHVGTTRIDVLLAGEIDAGGEGCSCRVGQRGQPPVRIAIVLSAFALAVLLRRHRKRG